MAAANPHPSLLTKIVDAIVPDSKEKKAAKAAERDAQLHNNNNQTTGYTGTTAAPGTYPADAYTSGAGTGAGYTGTGTNAAYADGTQRTDNLVNADTNTYSGAPTEGVYDTVDNSGTRSGGLLNNDAARVDGMHHGSNATGLETGMAGLDVNGAGMGAGGVRAGMATGGLPDYLANKEGMVCVPGNVAAPVPVGRKVFTVREDHAVEKEKVERWTEHRPVERDYVTRVEATGNITEQGVYADQARAREAVVAEAAVEAHPTGQKYFTVAEDHAVEKERVERWTEHRPVEREFLTRVEATGNVVEQGVYADNARAREAVIAEQVPEAHPTGQTFFNVAEDHAVEKERVERWVEHRPVERDYVTKVEATGVITEQGAYAGAAKAQERVLAESTCFPVGTTTTEGVVGNTQSGTTIAGVNAQAAPL